MRPLTVRAGSMLTLLKSENPQLTDEASRFLVDRFSERNPAYLKAVLQGRSTYRTPERVFMAHDLGDRIVLHRGLMAELQQVPGVSQVIDATVVNPAAMPSPSVSPRDYQDRAVAALRARRQGVLCAPTGSGKTIMSVRLLCELGQQALILVHTKDLADQWAKVFKDKCDLTVGVIQGSQCDVRPVTVAMMQSLDQHMDAVKGQFGAVLADECHHTPSDTLRRLIDRLPARYRFGVTATLNRADGLDFLIHACLGPVVHTVSAEDLYASGSIIRPTIIPVDTEVEEFGFDGYTEMIQALIGHEGRNRLILSTVFDETAAGNCSLVLSHRVEHAQELHRRWTESTDIPAVLATGSSKKADREAALEAIRNQAAHVLFATKIADEGLDLPRLNRLFLTCPSRHHSKVVQQIGRITRPYPGKADAVVFDFVDWNLRLAASQFQARRAHAYETIGGEATASPRAKSKVLTAA